jgi:hypothetical protein
VNNMARDKPTILVTGMIAAVPRQGGWTWAVLQYLLGLKQLGHEVIFCELMDQQAVRPAAVPLEQSENAAYFRQVMADFGLTETAVLLLDGTRQTVGLSHAALKVAARRADMLVNISGVRTDPELCADIPIRVYLDLDPGFTQLWQTVQGIDMRLAGHTHFVTIGLGIGTSDCPVPRCGLDWITTLQPIVLPHWPPAERIVYDGLTTVANWRGYGSIEYQGVLHGQKVHSFRQFIDLPTRTPEKCMPALAIHADESRDLSALVANGWQVLDPAQVADSPQHYQQFVQGSKAELGIAKSGYVASRCGWFSDRSICYLASGRPVLAQETGFSQFLPTGPGLFAFSTLDDVLTGIEVINRDYRRQARAARALAEEFFDSNKVLRRLFERIGVSA